MQDEETAKFEENALFCNFVTSPSLWFDWTLIMDKHKAMSWNGTKTITIIIL